MKYTSLLILMCVICGALALGQDSPPPREPRAESSAATANGQNANKPKPGITSHPLEVLSDTGGFDLHSYLNQMMRQIKDNWYKNVPASARAPIMKKGKVSVGFRVMKDGKIEDPRYLETSGDSSLDSAAYESVIGSSPFLPLPSGFACQYVVLRFNFLYNPSPRDLVAHAPIENELLPCVTTKIHVVGQIGIEISPISTQLAPNAKEQFSATVTGDLEIVFLSECSSSQAKKNRIEGPLFPKMTSGYRGASTH